jgi:hypothetical protein
MTFKLYLESLLSLVLESQNFFLKKLYLFVGQKFEPNIFNFFKIYFVNLYFVTEKII